MSRFFCPAENINNDIVVITQSSEVHHMVNVLRHKINDKITIFDGRGKEYSVIIEEIKKRYVRPRILEIKDRLKLRPRKIKISLACAIPRLGRFDYIIEKCTELGVYEIIPLVSKRSVVSVVRERRQAKLRHWETIAINASKQSGKSIIPRITPIIEFPQILKRVSDYEVGLLFCLSAKVRNLQAALRGFKEGKILLLIGPEGDFTDGEIADAQRSGCRLVGLGDSVLRVDTAAIAATCLINFLYSQ
jgi:16S rRNA (uracil1498-N3)-methyltransferase